MRCRLFKKISLIISEGLSKINKRRKIKEFFIPDIDRPREDLSIDAMAADV